MKKRKHIETPRKLRELFCKYVEYERNYPMYKIEYVGNGYKIRRLLSIPTFDGFECWLADKDVINDLKEYFNIITRIKQTLFPHRFE